MNIGFQHGITAFSLIELIVVITIVALLSAIAVPSYSQYMIKARTAEFMNIIGAQMTLWEVNYNSNTPFYVNIPNPTYWVDNIDLSDASNDNGQGSSDLPGAISVNTPPTSPLLSPNLDAVSFYFVPTVSANGVITWVCYYDNNNTRADDPVLDSLFTMPCSYNGSP